jgi:hypothetical protein
MGHPKGPEGPAHPRVFFPARLVISLLLVATGCQSGPPVPVTPGLPSTAPSPVGPTAGPSTAVSPSPAATGLVVTTEGPITRADVPAGQQTTLTTPAGRRLTTVLSNASDQPATIGSAMSSSQAAPFRAQATTPQGRLTVPGEAAARVLAGPRGPARRVLAAPTRAIGDQESFWINTGDFTPETDVRRTAVLKRVSPHAYLYVDAEAPRVDEARLDAFVTAFEEQIYPRVTGVFGPEARPGVDGDGRIFLVFSPAVHGLERNTDLLGYFWAPDVVPNPPAGSHSNQKEALFLSNKLLAASPLLAYGSVAHELQHLINFTRKGPRLNYQANEATWLDEGMAMLAMEVAGYGLAQGERLAAESIAEYQARPEAYSLTDWPNNPTPAFGQSYLFVRYMVDRHGEALLKELLDTDKRGREAIDVVLARRGDTFAGLFQAWTLANVLSDSPLASGTPYRYRDLNLRGTYGGVTLPGFRLLPGGASATVDLKPWGTAYHRYTADPAQPWRWTLTAPAGARVLGAAIAENP